VTGHIMTTNEPRFRTLAPDALAPSRLLSSLGISARKSLGQNFLTSKTAIHHILVALDVQPHDTVVEIGAGLGVLTGYLAAHAGRVMAIEIDEALAAHLCAQFSNTRNVTVLQTDILEFTPRDYLDEGSPRYKVVGNLPYYITSLVLRRVLHWKPEPSLIVVTMQEEVARRICASAGDMSLLALMVQLHGSPRIVSRIPPGAFVPPPKVRSSIVQITPHDEPQVSQSDEELLFHLARTGFRRRRKLLLNSLTAALPIPKAEIADILEQARISASSRPQELTPADWVNLARVIRERGLA